MSGVKGIIGMHRFNICLVVVLLWCENTITISGGPLDTGGAMDFKKIVCSVEVKKKFFSHHAC